MPKYERSPDPFERFSRAMDRAFGCSMERPLPTMEELQSTFPHKKGCSQSQQLNAIGRLEFLEGFGGFDIGEHVRNYYLNCNECHTEKQFDPK